MHTLTDPLFVVKQEYTMRPPFSKKDAYLKVGGSPNTAKNAKSPAGNLNKDIIQDSYVFYKPFKDKNGLYHLASFAIDKNGELLHKTFYELDRQSKLERLIKSDDENIVYVKPTLTLPNHNTIAEFSRPSTAMDSAATTSGKETDSSDSTTESVLLSKRNESEVSLAKAQAKFNYDEKKAKDLLEWHKDSHPLTKDSDGMPKVFYHGSKAKDLEEFKSEFDQSGLGFWFNADENRAKAFAKSNNDRLYSVFLHIKKPFDLNQSITTKNVKELSELLGEDLHKYIATDKQSLQKELDKATKSKDFAVIEGRGLMLESNKKISEYAYNYNGKWYVNLYNEADLQREGLEKLLPFMQKAQNLNQTKTITELLNEKEIGEYQKNTHTFLQKLKTKGYDSILPNGKAKNDDIVIFDSKQIKHINNKGSYTDSNGNITATKPKGVEAKHKYFNEASPNIYQSNPHIGSGLVSGTLAGVETDEQGNIIGFDPAKFALGFLGGAGGSVALSKGFRFVKENPQYKEALKRELADSLAKGWEATTKQYPILKTLEPMRIVQSEKGRIAQAGHILNKLEQKEAKGLVNVTYNGKNASVVYKDLENIDEAILYVKGTKKKGGAHIRLSHSTDKTQQGYVSKLEVARLGKDICNYLQHNEPFTDSNGARLYEWENKEGVRFRVVVDDIRENSGGNSHLPSATEEIITFYSDRNLKERMKFKNKALQRSDFTYYKPYERDNLVHSKSEILDLEDTLRYTKERLDNVEYSLRSYHYAHKIAQELLDKRGGGKYNELDSAAKQELMKEAVKIRENRVKQEAPALKEKYAKEIQELESKLQTFKEQNKEAKEQYLNTYQAEIKDYETQEAIRKEQYLQQQQKEREALRKKREQELKEYGVEIDEDYVEDLITNGGYTHQDIQHIKNKAKEGNTLARQILENFDTTHSGSGYNGCSMSNNAIEAYNNGLMPLNKWGKQEADELSDLLGVKVGIAQLKRFLKEYGERGYHHTSRFYNKYHYRAC